MPSTNPDMAHVEALEAEIRRLREAHKRIRSLKPEPIGDTGFCTGPKALFDQAQRIARAALKGAQS